MRVKKIKLSKKTDLPVSATVILTLAEIKALAEYTGTVVPSTPATSAIYLALVSQVVNPYWDNGYRDIEL